MAFGIFFIVTFIVVLMFLLLILLRYVDEGRVNSHLFKVEECFYMHEQELSSIVNEIQKVREESSIFDGWYTTDKDCPEIASELSNTEFLSFIADDKYITFKFYENLPLLLRSDVECGVIYSPDKDNIPRWYQIKAVASEWYVFRELT